MTLVLRSHAVLTAALGIFLVSATWDELYEAFGVRHPGEAIYAQVGGAFALALAYVLWIAPRSDDVTRAVAAASAVANALIAAVAVAWLMHDRFDLGSSIELAVLAAVAAFYAGAEAWIASRSVAMLGPGD